MKWRWLASIRRCDACNRVRATRFSPDHGANFCRRHFRENNADRALPWRTWLPHTRERAGYRIIQITGGRRWSLAVYLKPRRPT